MKRPILVLALAATVLGLGPAMAQQAKIEGPAPTRVLAEPAPRRRAALRPPARPRLGVLVRYAGSGAWSLSEADTVHEFFERRFGRPLPVSAWGQTILHDRLRLDHRNAFDVAVHPDSTEGRALMAFLRSEGIPFVAVRSRLPGRATGAHIHVGPESCKLPRSWQPVKVVRNKAERTVVAGNREGRERDVFAPRRPELAPDDHAVAGSLASDRSTDKRIASPLI